MNFQTALAHHQAGRLAEAEAMYRQILASQPQHADTLHLLGVLAAGSGRSEEGVTLISRAIVLLPGVAVFHSNLAVSLRRLDRMAEAITHFRQALALDPRFADAHMNLGEALFALGELDESIACSQRALALRPDFPEALDNLGNALAEKRRFTEALACHQRAVALAPQLASAHNDLGHSLMENGRPEEAIVSFQRALALQPSLVRAQGNLAVTLAAMGRVDEALALYRQALAAQPDMAEIHWNYALLLLQLGQWEEGWREYEWRWRYAGFPSRRRNFSAPQWDGTPAPGATILIHCEQGIGDAIQFMRYVPFVRERANAARVIVECEASLARLLAQSGGWNAEIVARDGWDGARLPAFDLHLPLLSLSLALKQFAPLAMTSACLRSDPQLRDAWRERLGADRFRVGLVWAGNSKHKGDRRRSLALDQLDPLLRVPGVEFINLQVGTSEIPAGVCDFSRHIADFADTAALIAELDLVITVDTAVAHLAGALGAPVWTLLPFVSDWRWGLGRDDTVWYPTMRLFRQRTPGDWREVIERVAAALLTVQP